MNRPRHIHPGAFKAKVALAVVSDGRRCPIPATRHRGALPGRHAPIVKGFYLNDLLAEIRIFDSELSIVSSGSCDSS